MDVKFVTTLRSLVDTVPITDGQVVVCKDSDDMFYDMGQNRRRVGPCLWKPFADDVVTTGFTMRQSSMSVIQFVPNGGTDVVLQDSSPANFVIGTVGDSVPYYSMPVTERSGFEFLGWYEDQECRSVRVDAMPSKYPRGKTIYYASWKS